MLPCRRHICDTSRRYAFKHVSRYAALDIGLAQGEIDGTAPILLLLRNLLLVHLVHAFYETAVLGQVVFEGFHGQPPVRLLERRRNRIRGIARPGVLEDGAVAGIGKVVELLGLPWLQAVQQRFVDFYRPGKLPGEDRGVAGVVERLCCEDPRTLVVAVVLADKESW